ncbi:unnamed protein product [Lathyrus sativus]|nr:unnamed protein product [Lathyrus sativus]
MSTLDYFLLSDYLIVYWKIVCQIVGKRDILDHCPIWLKSRNKNWGLKPFKFNKKLILLKSILRRWSVEVFGWIDLRVDETIEELFDLESLVSRGGQTVMHDVILARAAASSKLWRHWSGRKAFLDKSRECFGSRRVIEIRASLI